ncbi:MAG: hypothetical protein WD080_01630 [Egibacteraceae bacterium]
MHTWTAAARVLRAEAGRIILRRLPPQVPPLVAVVGGARPAAAIALRNCDPDRPNRTVAELVLLAASFRPERILVGLPFALDPTKDRRSGVLVVHDLQCVLDGFVEVTRVRAWRRLGRRVLWQPTELRQCEILDAQVALLAREVVAERPAEPEPDVQERLVARSLAAGQVVRIAPSMSRTAR